MVEELKSRLLFKNPASQKQVGVLERKLYHIIRGHVGYFAGIYSTTDIQMFYLNTQLVGSN